MHHEILSRWPVLLSPLLGPSDRDSDGNITEPAARRLFADGRSAYLGLCESVDPTALTELTIRILVGNVAVGDQPVVTVDVIEVFGDRFTMSMRIRPEEGPGIAASGRCTLAPDGGVPTEMRDEFIALAHSARYTN